MLAPFFLQKKMVVLETNKSFNSRHYMLDFLICMAVPSEYYMYQ